MAKTTTEIEDDIYKRFAEDDTQQGLWGYTSLQDVQSNMPQVCAERALFHAAAGCARLLYEAWDAHLEEVMDIINRGTAHNARYYRDLVMKFRGNAVSLAAEGTEMRDETAFLETANTVSPIVYAAASATEDGVIVKVAGEDSKGLPCEITSWESAIQKWMARVKDAGVKLTVIAQSADTLHIELKCQTSRTVDEEDADAENDLEAEIIDAINRTLRNLPFDGSLAETDITTAALSVPGIDAAKITKIVWKNNERTSDDVAEALPLRMIPYSGYFALDNPLIEIEKV